MIGLDNARPALGDPARSLRGSARRRAHGRVNLIAYAAGAMIGAGALILVLALLIASRIIAELPEGRVRRWWNVLRALIVLFVLGYGSSLLLLPRGAGVPQLVISTVFFFGAVFVFMVCRLMQSTVVDVRRMAKLEVENITDPLLGIYNRRYMEQRLKEETARANRYNLPLSLAILDVDHFKRVNDAYGHPIGDEVLRRLCDTLRAKVREVDLFARYGGEEFVVVLPNTGEREAWRLAERLRKAAEESPIVIESGGRLEFKTTVSIGTSTCAAGTRDGEQLLRAADQALYRAKSSGRNRVEALASAH